MAAVPMLVVAVPVNSVRLAVATVVVVMVTVAGAAELVTVAMAAVVVVMLTVAAEMVTVAMATVVVVMLTAAAELVTVAMVAGVAMAWGERRWSSPRQDLGRRPSPSPKRPGALRPQRRLPPLLLPSRPGLVHRRHLRRNLRRHYRRHLSRLRRYCLNTNLRLCPTLPLRTHDSRCAH